MSSADTPNQATMPKSKKKSRSQQSRADYRASLQAPSGDAPSSLPKKHFYRQRAHANPFSDHALE